MYSLALRALFVVTEIEMQPRKNLNKTCKSYLTGFSQQKLKYCNSSTVVLNLTYTIYYYFDILSLASHMKARYI